MRLYPSNWYFLIGLAAISSCAGDMAVGTEGASDTSTGGEPTTECLPANLLARGRSHIGCEFYAMSSSANTPNKEALGVFVINPGDRPATVRAEQPPWSGEVVEVAPHATARVLLPWATDIVTPGGKTALSRGGAAHIESDRPIIVAQYNAVVPTVAGGDSSLLLPVTSWEMRHVVASYKGPEIQPGVYYEGFYVVVASQDATRVKLSSPAGVQVHGGPGVGVDGSGELILNRGDVLQVLAKGPSDLTGSFVEADKPVQVLGGQRCGKVPADGGWCEHLEESVPPIVVLGTTHAVVPPVMADDPALRRAQIVRVIAAEADTALAFAPQVAPATVLGAGEFLEIDPIDQPFVVESTRPVLVVQYMLGGKWDDSRADPAMTVTPSVASFANEQWFHTIQGWDATDVDIIAPAGAKVQVDAAPLEAWSPIPESMFVVGHVRLVPDDANSPHAIVADVPIGVSVYAMGVNKMDPASYWHPAGYAVSTARISR